MRYGDGLPNRGIERFRRIFLYSGIVLCVVLRYWTNFEPLMQIHAVLDKQQFLDKYFVSDSAESPDILIRNQQVDTPPRINVQGVGWEKLFSDIQAKQNGEHPAGLKQRSPRDWIYDSLTYFKPYEEPFAGLSGQMKMNEEYLLVLKQADEEKYLDVYYMPPYEIASLGTGIKEIPVAFAYPLRNLSWIMLAAGLLLYIFLPRQSAGTDLVRITVFRSVMMDIVGILMFGCFFWMPFAVVSSTQAALSEYIVLSAMFFIMAAIGSILIFMAIRVAAKGILILPDRLRISSIYGIEDFLYSQIDYVQLASVSAKQGLVKASFAATLLSGSLAGAAGQFGRSLLLASSDYKGLFFHTVDGRTAFLWNTDAFGKNMMTNFFRMIDHLEAAGVPSRNELLQIKCFIPPER